MKRRHYLMKVIPNEERRKGIPCWDHADRLLAVMRMQEPLRRQVLPAIVPQPPADERSES